MKHFLLLLFFFFISNSNIFSQEYPPKILIVTAHPDDETAFVVTLYKAAHDFKAKIDLALITNGEGGYKYSTLAEAIYGLELTDEAIGREYLPSIRKKELMAAGKIIGIRNFYFFDQKDTKYTTDIEEVFPKEIWNFTLIKNKIKELITKENYDMIFCLLPTPETHAHHKATTILVLQVIADLEISKRPIIFGISVSNKNEVEKNIFSELPNFPITRTNQKVVFHIDRTTPFGYNSKLNYKVIANWVIAEHKSQGTMQLYMNAGDIEDFYFFDINDPEKIEKANKFFEALKTIPFKSKKYAE